MTIIMVAHRLTTVENSDEIIVLENGTISAKGAYSELTETSDYFRSLVSKEADIKVATVEN